MPAALIVLLTVQPALSDSAFVASEPESVVVDVVDASEQTYTVNLGGTADMDSTLLQGYSTFDVGFQPNISLVIENTGDTPVIDPRVVINRRGDWRDVDHILEEALRHARTAQEKILFLYEFARTHRYHDHPLFEHAELHDPVKHFNNYGAGLCDDMGSVTCALAHAAGLHGTTHGLDPVNRAMHGHVMSELPLDGRLQFIDTDENAFYLGPNNERPLSGDEIMRDSYWAAREHCYGPLFSKWDRGEPASAFLGRDDRDYRSIALGHEMHVTLRPGEKLTYRWDNEGKTPGAGTLRHFANSSIELRPPLNQRWLDEHTVSMTDVEAQSHAFVGSTLDSQFAVEISSPYPIAGAHINAIFSCESAPGLGGIDISLDGETWQQVCFAPGRSMEIFDEDIDKALGIATDRPVYRYYVRFRLGAMGELPDDLTAPGNDGDGLFRSGNMYLYSPRIRTTLLTAPLSLPRLSLGKNVVRYSDATDGPHRVRITHNYQESSNITPPPAPSLEYPPPNATLRDATPSFEWGPVEGAAHYRLRVSRRADLRLPYRPAFDVITAVDSHESPFAGLFSPSHTYYWSVCARNSAGLWGEWAPVRSFRWAGPMPPAGLAIEDHGDDIWLTWLPSDRVPRPERYEVHASNRRGFRPCNEPHEVYALGTVGPTLVGATAQPRFRIVSPGNDTANTSSYRVVAIDSHGTPSGPSWVLEIPCPRIYSRPSTRTRVGEPYEYAVRTLRCDGDLQYRYQDPGYAYWEREGYVFSLREHPDWLTIDPVSGVVSGTPPVPGEYRVRVLVTRTWPDEVGPDQYRPEPFVKSAAEFAAQDEQRFILTAVD